MSGNWRFSTRNLLGVVAVFAVALGLTRFLLSTLPTVHPSAAVGFLFFEAVIAVYVWGLFVCDVFGVTQVDNRWRNLGSAVFTLVLVGVSYSMFLPA